MIAFSERCKLTIVIFINRAPVDKIRRSNLFKKFVKKEKRKSEINVNPFNKLANDKILTPKCGDNSLHIDVFKSAISDINEKHDAIKNACHTASIISEENEKDDRNNINDKNTELRKEIDKLKLEHAKGITDVIN